MDEIKKNSLIRDMDTKKFEIYDNIINNLDELSNITEIIFKMEKQIEIDNNKLNKIDEENKK